MLRSQVMLPGWRARLSGYLDPVGKHRRSAVSSGPGGEGVLAQASSVVLFEMQIRLIKKSLFGFLDYCDEIVT